MSVKKKNSETTGLNKKKDLNKKPEPATKKQKVGKASGQSVPGSTPSLLSSGAKDIYLLDALSDEKAALQAIVNDWLSSYQEDQVEAIYQLLGVIVKVSGCTDVVSKESLRQEAHIVKVLEELQESIKDSSPEAPFLSKTKDGKKLRSRLLDFFRLLVKLGLHDAFSEPTLLQFIKGWFVIMSSSAYRIFRQIATTISLKFMTYLCDAAHELETQKDVSLQQTAGSKRKGKVATKKKDYKPQEIASHLTLLSHNIEELFNGIFCHRFKDIDHTIRTEAIGELGVWVVKYPNQFLNETHLKYFKWQLSDKSSAVRSETLKSLLTIFERDTFLPALRSLVSSIKTRLLELACKEVDLETKCLSIKLLFNIYSRGLLESKDCSELNPLLFHPEESVRNAIAPFIKYTIDEELLPELADSELHLLLDAVSRPDRCKLSIKCFINLLSARQVQPATFQSLTSKTFPLFETAEGLNVAARELSSTQSPIFIATQALLPHFDPLRDWAILLELASKDPAKGRKRQISLTEQEEPYVLEMIAASFQILAIEHSNPPKSLAKSNKQNSEPSSFSQLRNHLAQDSNSIKDIIQKHSDNPQSIIQVLKILENSLEGELFLESNNLKTLLDLVTLVQKVVINHEHFYVLYQAAKTLRTLGTFNSGVPQEFSSLMNSLYDDLLEQLIKTKNHPPNKIIALRKVRVMLYLVGSSFGSSILSDSSLVSSLWDDIDDGIFSKSLDEIEIAILSLSIIHLSWLWSCQILNNDNLGDNQGDSNNLVLTRDKLLRTCLKILELQHNRDLEGLSDLQLMAFTTANEVCWLGTSSPLFKNQKPHSLLNLIESACIHFIKHALMHWETLIQSQEPNHDNNQKISLILDDLAARHCFNQMVITFLRSAVVGVFGLNSTIEIVSRSGGLDPLMEDSIKLFLNQGVKRRLKEASDSSTVRLVFGSLGDSLTEGLKRCSSDEPLAKFDGVINLTKSIAAILRSVGSNASRISQAVALFHQSTVWSAFQALKLNPTSSAEEKQALQPFRFLSLLLKGIVAPMHSRELLRQVQEAAQEINPDHNSVDWLPYFAYIKNLEEIQPSAGVPPPDFVAPQNPVNA